ncbi:acetyl-CoA synthetase-like protein [Trametes polyzona]|nr:acetyl-CoA synthetase-like protein [Trametes polyzona]
MRPFEGDASTFKWGLVTYQDFLDALQKELLARGLKRGDIVGIWLKGSHWEDLVQSYAVSAAGFVPEVFGPPFSATFFRDLLDEHAAHALIYSNTFEALLPQVEWRQIAILLPKPPVLPIITTKPGALADVDENDVSMIFHTSGTTGGRPKPVSQTHKWLLAEGEITWKCVIQRFPEGQHVFNNIGSFASIGAASYVTFMSWSGACLIQSSGREITADEFLAMKRQCGLNFLLRYAPWLATLLTAARARSEALEALSKSRPLMVASLASGEPYLRLAPQVKCQLIPADSDSGGKSSIHSLQLHLFFVSADSKTCPHPAVRNRPDGHVTEDLFEEVKPDCYVFRGRSDDWIRTGGNPAFCDKRAIEENVMKTCGDVVHNCVVVGHQRVFPVLVVEPEGSVDVSTAEATLRLKGTIIERTAPFNERLFPHERIAIPECIMLVPVASLPRTTEKGNIRRKATEEHLKDDLEAIYSSIVRLKTRLLLPSPRLNAPPRPLSKPFRAVRSFSQHTLRNEFGSFGYGSVGLASMSGSAA